MSIFSFNPFKSAPPTIPLAAKKGLTRSEGGERERESRLGGRGWGLVAPAQKGQKSLRLSLYGRVTRSQPRSSLRYLQNQGFGRRDPLGTSERKEATRLSLPTAFLNARPSFPQTRTQNNQDFELAQSRDRLVGVWGL